MKIVEDRWVRRALFIPPQSRRIGFIPLLAFAFYLAIALACQIASNANGMGFGSYPDEPSHYVTGLMVHDYLLSGFHQPPLEYAHNYYLHLPLIGIGHWPPLFYAIEGIWMLLAGTSRQSALFLIAIISAVTSLSLFLTARRLVSPVPAFLIGCWFLGLPVVRWSDDLVMMDGFAALTVFWAAVKFGRFMDSERLRDSVEFGMLAGLAFLAKPNALCLIFIPPLVIAVTGRFYLLLSRRLWAAVPAVIVLTLPWYYFTLRQAYYGHPEGTLAELVAVNLPLALEQIANELTILVPLAILGLVLWIARARAHTTGVPTVMAVLPFAVLASVLLSRVGSESRYLIAALMPLLIAAAASLEWLFSSLKSASTARVITISVFCAVTLVFCATSRLPGLLNDAPGVAALARAALAKSPPQGTTMLLVAPKAAREGRILAELAMLSPVRPKDVIARSTKLLADMNWSGSVYSACCASANQLYSRIEASGIDLLLLDTSNDGPGWEHYKLARQLISSDPSHFRESGAFPSPATPVYKLYQVLPHHPAAPRTDLMEHKLDEEFPLPGHAHN